MTKVKLELNIPGELKDKPFFYQIIKEFDIVLSILEASFSTEIGWAIITLEAQEQKVEEVIKYLKNSGVEVKLR